MNEFRDLDDVTKDEDDEEINMLQTCDSLINRVTENVSDMVTDIAITDLTLEPLSNASFDLRNTVDSLVPLIKSKRESNDRVTKELYEKLQNAEIQRVRDQAEIKNLKTQMMIHSDYCSNVGAVLGNLVWRASCNPEMVKNWLSERRCLKKLEEIVTITDRVAVSFFKTYEDVLPPKSTNEYEFPMVLLGTVSNISANPEGRQFLIDNRNGMNLLRNLVTYFSLIPMNSGSSDTGYQLKKMILTILWNMCVNEDGLRYLYEVKIGQVIQHCLVEHNAAELRALGLQLLQLITLDRVDPRLLDDLLGYVPLETIRRLANGESDVKVANLAREIIDRLSNREKSMLRQKIK